MAELSEKKRDGLSNGNFAFLRARKEPINDARHVRAAVSRFDQVEDVSNSERDEAWKRIERAAKKYDVELDVGDWRDLYKRNDRPIPKA